MSSNQPTEIALRLKVHAKQMRRQMNPSEAILWSCIRKKQLGVQFRRQQVIGHSIVDFLAPKLKLVVEVDGQYHQEVAAADARRDRRLWRAGYTVLRVPAQQLFEEPALAVAQVASAVRALRVGQLFNAG